TFSWTRGAHSFKFGFDFNDIVDNARSAINSGGNYQYTSGSPITNISCAAPTVSDPTQQSAANKQNLIFCDWLVELYRTDAKDTFTGGLSRTGRHWDTYNQFFDMIYPTFPLSFNYDIPNRDYSMFAQDTWKIRPNITLNLGVRYDLQQLPDLPYSPA